MEALALFDAAARIWLIVVQDVVLPWQLASLHDPSLALWGEAYPAIPLNAALNAVMWMVLCLW